MPGYGDQHAGGSYKQCDFPFIWKNPRGTWLCATMAKPQAGSFFMSWRQKRYGMENFIGCMFNRCGSHQADSVVFYTPTK